jgi:hypothetical protein
VLSLAVTIQALGSEPEAAQTLAVRVDPTTRKWMVYEVPAVAVNGTLARIVVVPATFF